MSQHARLLRQEFDSPLGPLVCIVAAAEGLESLCLLEFHDRPRLPREVPELVAAFGAEPENAGAALHDEVQRQLAGYFAGGLRRFDLPLGTPGTGFQQKVWAALRQIPYGSTCSYSDLAVRIGSPGSQRAVGAANGANRIAIVIPCHRVIESTGALRGYGGGLARKRWLLELEGALSPAVGLFDAPAGAGAP
ncbi:MAG TPA: methylated-DNA--[protein]-cysteine S-methyltransferase [Phycisphaerales bacterium]|nr:methylated-DNA--[protein]-cysteine S-methyltransferase [Phycisphaerales bacterium]